MNTVSNTFDRTINRLRSGFTPDTRSLLFNASLYQAGWFAVVLGAAWGSPILGSLLGIAAIAVHLAVVEERRVELERIGVALLVGLAVELLNARLGIFRGTSGVLAGGFSPWLLVIWAGFATAFHRSLRWLLGRPVLAIALGAIAGPLAFWGGERMGAITMTRDPMLLAVLALEWAIALPLLIGIYGRLGARRALPASKLAVAAAAALVLAASLPAAAQAQAPNRLAANRIDLASNCSDAEVARDLSVRGDGSYEYLGFIDVMDAALYDAPTRRAEPVLGPVPKCLVIRYKRDFDAEDFADVTVKGIAQNVTPAELERLMPRIERFNRLYRNVKEGDRYALAFVPGTGTVLSYNGKARGVIEGADFAKALFSIWLGNEPMDEDLRKQLLGTGNA